MSNEKDSKSQVEDTNVEVEETASQWYYFYSQGCGFCKKAEPIVDELNKEGHNILKLDMAEADNQGLSNELKKEYKAQCGTPWFINAETGHQVCGFREKDIIEKWVKGEEIPQPVRPTGPPPKVPLMGADAKEIKSWKKEYNVWYKKNEKLPNVKTASQLLELPRPKTDPPKPPAPNADDKALNTWKEEYDKWAEENTHLPNVIPGDTIVERFKQRRDGVANQPSGGAAKLNPEQEARLQRVEQKLDKLIKHLGVK